MEWRNVLRYLNSVFVCIPEKCRNDLEEYKSPGTYFLLVILMWHLHKQTKWWWYGHFLARTHNKVPPILFIIYTPDN